MLSKKIAIITGATKGIGKAITQLFADSNAIIYGIGRDECELNALEQYSPNIHSVKADVCHTNEFKNIFQTIYKQHGHIDILVNNAGVVEYSSGLHDHTTEQWDKVLNTDLKGVFLMGREVSKVMMKQNSGKIINIASVGGIQAGPAQVSYFAAKGGVVNLTKAMAGDLAPYGILVNAIAPGVYDTEMTHGALDAPGSLVLKNRVALKRFGREGEMNGALVYFASDACTYTTGQTLVVDGGMTSML